MIYKIQYFPEAEDDLDADASEPKYVCYAQNEDEVEVFIGMIERNKVEEEVVADF